MKFLMMETDIAVPEWFVWVAIVVLVAAIICTAYFAFRQFRRSR
jgi:hypothetical protein